MGDTGTAVGDRSEEAPGRERLLDALRAVARTDGVLPTEPTLAAGLGLSRPRLRELLAELQVEGLISRRRGSGTTVNVEALDVGGRLDHQADHSELLARCGYVPSVDLLAVEQVALDAEEQERFGLPPGTLASRTIKRWRADGRPAMVAVDLVPLPPGTSSLPGDLQRSVFDLIEDLTGESVAWTFARPLAVVLDETHARWLETDPGAPALQITQSGSSREGRRLFSSVEHHVPGVVPYTLVRVVDPR